MELFLIDHNYKYAAEQIMLLLFPGEKPVYPERHETDFWTEIRLFRGEKRATAICRLYVGKQAFIGRAITDEALFTDRLLEDRYLQRIIKLSFYRAGIQYTGKRPPWGAVTGVRPGKLMSAYLNSGMSEPEAKAAFIKEYDVSSDRASLCLETARYTRKVQAGLEVRDVCLYIGIPFCPTRCAYCTFVSQTVSLSGNLVEPFVDALLRDIGATAEQVNAASLRVISVYFGGGTPTSLSASQLDRIFSHLKSSFDLSFCTEVTVEAGRPDTITPEKLRVMERHGVTRISVNPQSMADDVLKAIGRRHTAKDVVEALALVRGAGGFCVNMDLIAGLPDDSVDSFQKSLEAVLSLRPENITVHTLSLKKGSRIMLEETPLPSEGDTRRMVDFARGALSGAAYAPYYFYRQKYMSGGLENVGWSLEGFPNIYNICIMEELCGIISMGAGGSTKLIAPGGKMLRRFAPKYPLEYIGSIDRTLSRKEEIKEFYNEL